MRKFTARIIAFTAIAACVWAVAYYGFLRQDKQQYNFKTAKIEKKDIIQSIDATGTVEPEELVDVGARVSGEIVAFGKDKNGKEYHDIKSVEYGNRVIKYSTLIGWRMDTLDSRMSKTETSYNPYEMLGLSENDFPDREDVYFNWPEADRLTVTNLICDNELYYEEDWNFCWKVRSISRSGTVPILLAQDRKKHSDKLLRDPLGTYIESYANKFTQIDRFGNVSTISREEINSIFLSIMPEFYEKEIIENR